MFRRATVMRAAAAPSVTAAALGITAATQSRLAAIVKANTESTANATTGASSSGATSSSAQQGLLREIQHIRRCNAEILKLLQWSEVRAILAPSMAGKPADAALSTAELIHLTAFSPSVMIHGRNDVHQHDANCPIQAGTMTMATIAMSGNGNNAPTVAPCQHCLRRRLNFLASEHFAHNMYWNSIMPTQNASNHLSNQKVYQLVREGFGSMRGLEDTLAEFAINRRDAGFTWLVYNPNAENIKTGGSSNTTDGTTATEASFGRLEVVNLPGSTSPVVLGMWPVLCVNLTTETIVDAFVESEKQASLAATTPTEVAHSWSRAARNPAAAATRADVTTKDLTLTDLRRAVASKQTKSLDLTFMEAQVQGALDYFGSETYKSTTADRKAALTRIAQEAVVKSFDNVEMDAVNNLKKAANTAAAAQAAEKAKKEAATAAAAKKDEKKPAATTTATESAAASSSSSAAASSSAATTEASAAETVVEETPVAPAEDEIIATGVCDDQTTRYTTRRSGVTTYTYANGTSTDVYPDGRQVAYTADLTTTTYPDGTVHYLYANGATVEIRPDGTKYVNGVLTAE